MLHFITSPLFKKLAVVISLVVIVLHCNPLASNTVLRFSLYLCPLCTTWNSGSGATLIVNYSLMQKQIVAGFF